MEADSPTPQCIAITRKGKGCLNSSLKGSDFCRLHGVITMPAAMSKYERVTVIISILALFVALASPIISYFLPDQAEREFWSRAKVQIVAVGESSKLQVLEESSPTRTRTVPSETPGTPLNTIPEGESKTVRLDGPTLIDIATKNPLDWRILEERAKRWQGEISVTGNRPAKEITLIAEYLGVFFTHNADGDEFMPAATFTPEIISESKIENDRLVIKFKSQIAPNSKIRVSLESTPERVIVISEYGETSEIKNNFQYSTFEIESFFETRKSRNSRGNGEKEMKTREPTSVDSKDGGSFLIN